MGQAHRAQRAIETQVRLLLLLNDHDHFFGAEIVFRKPVTYSDQSTRMWWQTYLTSIVRDSGGGKHANILFVV